jgi:hypothetical protein
LTVTVSRSLWTLALDYSTLLNYGPRQGPDHFGPTSSMKSNWLHSSGGEGFGGAQPEYHRTLEGEWETLMLNVPFPIVSILSRRAKAQQESHPATRGQHLAIHRSISDSSASLSLSSSSTTLNNGSHDAILQPESSSHKSIALLFAPILSTLIVLSRLLARMVNYYDPVTMAREYSTYAFSSGSRWPAARFTDRPFQ